MRPVVEYDCPMWHTNLPIYLSNNIEMIQKRVVRALFPGMSYIDLSTLKERRDYICKKYFINNMQASSHKVNCLLPEKGRLTMICDGVICTTTCYSNKQIQEFFNIVGITPLAMITQACGSPMFEQYEICEMLFVICVYSLYIMKLCLCNCAQVCQDVWRL